MAYIISSGESSDINLEQESLTMVNGGVQTFPDCKAAPPQIIYLDFDGELTKYRNNDLDLEIDNVQVEDSMLTAERIARIIAALNTDFSAYNVCFTSERPKDGTAYSTIFVGRTSAFDRYGRFSGLAETVDSGNRIKDDNAFVLLDAANSDIDIVSTIAHEAGHLIGTLDHGGDGLDRYAAFTYYYLKTNCILGGVITVITYLEHTEEERDILPGPDQNSGDQDIYVSVGERYDRAHGVIISGGALITLTSACSVNDARIENNGQLQISSGCGANNVTVNGGGIFTLGGTANDITVNPYGKVIVDGEAKDINAHGGTVEVNGEASGITVNSGGFLGVYHGSANGILIESDVRMVVEKDANVNNTTVKKDGSMSCVGTVDNTKVNGGVMQLSGNGKAISTTVDSKGSMYVSGGTANNTIVSRGVISVFFGAVAIETTVRKGGSMGNGGIANNTFVLSGGTMSISSGAEANNTTVGTGGKTSICTDGTANDTTVGSGGQLWVDSKGTANGVTIESSGFLSVAPGGTATILAADRALLALAIDQYTYVMGKVVDSYMSIKDGLASELSYFETLTVLNGGKVIDTTIEKGGHRLGGGEMHLSYGGQANRTTVNYGKVFVSSGGTANATTINSGTVDLSEGYTTAIEGGELCYCCVYSGGTANGTVINGGGLSVFHEGSANDTIVGGGKMLLYAGAASNTTVANGGILDINAGLASNTTVSDGGSCAVTNGGSLVTGTVCSGGSVFFDSGTYLDGLTTIGCGGQISFTDKYLTVKGTINFLLDAPADEEAPLFVQGLHFFNHNADLCITVCDDTSAGIYLLADGAAGFSKTVSVRNTSGDELGVLSLTGESIVVDGLEYLLGLEENVLFVEVTPHRDEVEVYDHARLTSSGKTMSDIVLEEKGDNLMMIYSGGTATNTTAGTNTSIIVSGGGTAIDLSIDYNAVMTMDNGATLGGTTNLAGRIRTEKNSTVSANNAEINLIVAGSSDGEPQGGFISGLDSLSGVSLSITVTESCVSDASYLIADGADGFTSNVSLSVAGENLCRVFEWNPQTQSYAPITIGNTSYLLTPHKSKQSGQTYLYLTIVNPIPDAAYEYIARKLAYKKERPYVPVGVSIPFQIGDTTYHFTVREFFDDESSTSKIGGFDAVLLERTDAAGNSLRQAILGCGGSEQVSDFVSDIDPLGIGYAQFLSNADEVYSACRELVQDGCSISFTGHSLGGALAQWFAVYCQETGGVQQTEDLVTFNSPGILTSNLLPTSKIKNVRHYICDGDLVSMAGVGFVDGDKSQYYLSTVDSDTDSYKNYFLDDQHTTYFFNQNGNLINQIKNESISELASDSFSYLTLASTENTDAFPNIVSVQNKDRNGYYLFNTQYAENILKLANGHIDLANALVTRNGVESIRNDPNALLESLWDTIFWKGKDYHKVSGSITVGNDNLTSTDGSTHDRIIRTLSYGNQDAPQLLFDFTNQEFIKLLHLTPDFTAEITPSTSEMVIRMLLERKGNQWICFSIPALDESTRYMLVKAMTNTDIVLSKANYFKKGSMWYIIDDPATEYAFTFSIDQSITTEKAVLLPGTDAVAKETEEFDLFISDIDASSLGNMDSISVQVRTASNPDGITVSLQETELEGLYRGTVSLNLLNLTDEDDHLTIVYEDADNGTGIAETIEKVLDIMNDDWDNSVFSPPENPVGTSERVAWDATGAEQYIVEFSTDSFEHALSVNSEENAVDILDLPAGTYQWRVKSGGGEDWAVGDEIVSNNDNTPKVLQSDADGNADVFFANPAGTWESGYLAQHVGSIGDWSGTNEYASVYGKNKLADIFEGSTDANILLMTDNENGDSLFVDDIYTTLPGSVTEQQARIARIDEIRAGAGNDIVDMTSQRFEYIGDGLTIRGGEGNDIIWANKGDNWLFGDAGNDRIVGASGNDVIAGGIGNDRMHGGGGGDVFTFCENWGTDNVEQLATGAVTLWFASGSLTNWDEAALTYTDGENSVKVSGVTAEQVTLKFGDDGSDEFASLAAMGAFFDATTERIFEESGKGILASL
ncbi:MAG: AIDA repeat-containing protein [Lentisphaeria bacterium]|nr:AIDA repeat-containing protein [Lentisphaeria bacterium]